jgi:hypothetical protein
VTSRSRPWSGSGLARLGVAAITALTLTGALPAAVASARALPVTGCSSSSSATVVVDFGPFGGPLLRACGSTPTTGFALLNQGGWHTSGTAHDGPAFVCRIGYAGFHHGTQYPTPAQQACINTPPVNAYWTYWQAGPGQKTWHYSQQGAPTTHPQPGSISLWIFGGTNLSGTAGSAVPAITPASLRRATVGTVLTGTPAIADAPPLAARQPVNRGSFTPALLAAAIAVALAAVGVGGARRRRPSGGSGGSSHRAGRARRRRRPDRPVG